MEPVPATGGADVEERHRYRLARLRALPGSTGSRAVHDNLVDALAELSLMRDVVRPRMVLRDGLIAVQDHETARSSTSCVRPRGPRTGSPAD